MKGKRSVNRRWLRGHWRGETAELPPITEHWMGSVGPKSFALSSPFTFSLVSSGAPSLFGRLSSSAGSFGIQYCNLSARCKRTQLHDSVDAWEEVLVHYYTFRSPTQPPNSSQKVMEEKDVQQFLALQNRSRRDSTFVGSYGPQCCPLQNWCALCAVHSFLLPPSILFPHCTQVR